MTWQSMLRTGQMGRIKAERCEIGCSLAPETTMAMVFKVGDHVSWNSEAGRVAGRIVRVHTKDVNYKGYTHHASKDEPQYEIKSDKTLHIALHKGSALRHLRR